jgi:aryl-alcohol dehydrogenase-like predicted oxidoreductase
MIGLVRQNLSTLNLFPNSNLEWAMQRIAITNLEGSVSIIGMGCASLGSRVGRRKGLMALNRAFDAGITWFDVAPSYGDGEAETILGEFVRIRRDRVHICTKVGLEPTRIPFAMRVAKPVLRSAVNAIPTLQKYVARTRAAASKLPITAEMISGSIDASLRKMRTDHVDVLALHEAEADEVGRDDVLAALERIVRLGKARTTSIASSLESGLLGIECSDVYGIVQIANNPFEPLLTQVAGRLPANRAITFVTHSVYGRFGALHRLRESIEANKTRLKMLQDEGYRGNANAVAAAFLADYALATNRAGITLFSMYKKEHLDFNLRRLEQLPEKARIKKLAQALIAP